MQTVEVTQARGSQRSTLTWGASVRWNSRVSIATAVGTLILASCCPRQFLHGGTTSVSSKGAILATLCAKETRPSTN